jgi:hypothetical protein
MSIFLLFKSNNNNNNNEYIELAYLYKLLEKVKTISRDNFSDKTIDTKISTKQNRKSDKRDTFAGTLNQTLTAVGSVRGYATRRNL